MHAMAELLYLLSHNIIENIEIYKDMQSIGCMSFFVIVMSQSPGLPETLAAAYNYEMCLWVLPVIVIEVVKSILL